MKVSQSLCSLLAAAVLPAGAQVTSSEFRPEIDAYLNAGPRTRLIFQESLNLRGSSSPSRDRLAGYFEIALRPILRRRLREHPDVFRSRYLSFRGGYQYSTPVADGSGAPENRVIAEITACYPLPGGIVVTDRNRGDFRFMRPAFSARYRNRLWLERDLTFSTFQFTPYAYDEIFFDTRYDAWSRNRVVLGLQFPAGAHSVAEPYLLYELRSRGSTHRVRAFGFKLSLYL